MSIKLTINIDGIADAMGTAAYGTAAKAIVERGTAYADAAYAAAGTVVLTPTASQYEWWDATGGATNWYRFRLWDNGTTYSGYSEPFQATALSAYATLDDFLERVALPDETKYNLCSDILTAVSAQFDDECGRQFYRIPQVSGTTVRTYDGDGSYTLWLPEGCVSLTTVEIAEQTNGTYVAAGTASYRLRPAYPAPDWPYTSLVLADPYTTPFTAGYDTVRLTGVFGWAKVPALIREAVLQLATLTYNASQTRAGGSVGLTDFGQVTLPNQRPDAWYRALRTFARRGDQPV